MSFPLRADVSDDVLAAFASIAVPSAGAPPLPPAVVDDYDDEEWSLDWGECDMSDPWSHDWGWWLGSSGTTAYIKSDQRATMLWRHRQWVVTSRATWKSSPEEFVGNLAVLGQVIDIPDWDEFAPHRHVGFFVGYARHEAEPRPWLLWARDRTLVAEDLNPPGSLY